jgi:hypothetical protein
MAWRCAALATLSEAGAERSKSAQTFAAIMQVPCAQPGGALGGMALPSSMVASHIGYLVREGNVPGGGVGAVGRPAIHSGRSPRDLR